MADQPPGTFPLVFESGVLSFDPDGKLRVFLSHSADAPHPLQTHPDGADLHVPPDVSLAVIRGDQDLGSVFGGFLETDGRPQGLELVISGYKLVKLEASGDLTVLVEGCTEPPAWFTPGKVHRFAGPDGPVRLWSGSAPVPKRQPQPRATPKPPPSPEPSGGGGCGLLLALLALGAGLAALGGLA